MAQAATGAVPEYEVYAIKYAHHERRSSENIRTMWW